MKLSITISSIAVPLLLSQAANGAGIGSQHVTSNKRVASNIPTDNANARLFPFLTRMRDGVVEFFFGRHPTKDIMPTPSALNQLRAQYANELVLRFNVSTTDEEAALADAAARLFLDIWAFTDNFADIRLHADEVAPLLRLLPKSLQSSYSTLIADLATTVYQSLPSDSNPQYLDPRGAASISASSLVAEDNIFFQDYQPLPVVIRWMRLLEAMFPSYVQYMTIGKSFEGRDIPGLRVGVPDLEDPAPPRKTIVVTGGFHAREWIATSTVNYLAWSFITAFGKEPLITKLLREFDIIFLPVVNPDGMEYTWEVDRLWRKTRQQTNLRYCRGIDLDHAFGYEWDGSQIQSDPCSESYGGEEAFQAVEAMQFAAWARNQTQNNVRFVGLLDLHSYSQQVLFPYSYSCAVEPPNLENLEELAAGIAKAIRLSNGESYSVASACEGAMAAPESIHQRVWHRIESGGGSAIDWFYHEMQAHFSYQIKLRDTGSYGFLLPKEHIIPTGEEMFGAMKYFGDYVLGNNGIESIPGDEEQNKDEITPGSGEDGNDSTSWQDLRRRRFRK